MEFDKLVHQPTRLQIFAYLYRHGRTEFGTLVSDLDVTEGNLASHVERMEDAEAVAVTKEFVDRTPRTSYALTEQGEQLFENHVAVLESLLDELPE